MSSLRILFRFDKLLLSPPSTPFLYRTFSLLFYPPLPSPPLHYSPVASPTLPPLLLPSSPLLFLFSPLLFLSSALLHIQSPMLFSPLLSSLLPYSPLFSPTLLSSPQLSSLLHYSLLFSPTLFSSPLLSSLLHYSLLFSTTLFSSPLLSSLLHYSPLFSPTLPSLLYTSLLYTSLFYSSWASQSPSPISSMLSSRTIGNGHILRTDRHSSYVAQGCSM